MKAGQLLLLLIGFIALSHLRRDMINGKKEIAFIQQFGEQKKAENTTAVRNNFTVPFAAKANGLKISNTTAP
jgi:serine kinase of HPr protein (carbohydrate metabolism regulator)